MMRPKMTFGDCLPRNFSWLEVNLLAGSSCPTSELELCGLAGIGIAYLVTLSAEALPPACPRHVQHLLLPVPDRKGASAGEFEQFFQLCDQASAEGRAVCVHCRGGRGRTGMFLAAYLIKYRGKTAEQAIQLVRAARPYSIETREQEQALHELQTILRPVSYT